MKIIQFIHRKRKIIIIVLTCEDKSRNKNMISRLILTFNTQLNRTICYNTNELKSVFCMWNVI